MRSAIIGGTGVYNLESNVKKLDVETEYGNVSVNILKIKDKEIVFLPRHGKNHSVPPHKINYRANMMALKKLNVGHIYATCAVGSMNKKYSIGSIVIISDFLDFTKNRITTFYDGNNTKVAHVDVSDIYCSYLRKKLIESDKDKLFSGDAVYVCTEGPRFETAAEIKMYKSLGADVVGMTNVPEVNLAKELGMCYSAVGIITNWATGFNDEEIDGHEISEAIEKNKLKLETLFINILTGDLVKTECKCKNSLIIL